MKAYRDIENPDLRFSMLGRTHFAQMRNNRVEALLRIETPDFFQIFDIEWLPIAYLGSGHGITSLDRDCWQAAPPAADLDHAVPARFGITSTLLPPPISALMCSAHKSSAARFSFE